jgi:poly-gamma-glutamate synthesis protein (capsule biosynthesis protein)
MDRSTVTLFLCGDVMTGRGIDQILPHPSRPHLFEPYVRSARDYVNLAEAVTGPIHQPVDFAYIWGDALAELRRVGPDVRVVNLETAITTAEDAWPEKGIHYRMHPANLPCLSAAGLDCCVLANNHVLDWGYAGLIETLDVLHQAGIHTAGAGQDAAAAAAPAVIDLPPGGRVLVFAFGMASSGVLPEWAARPGSPGVNYLEDLTSASADAVLQQAAAAKRPGDVVAVSIHWGSNWGYDISRAQRDFAHRLIDSGTVDLLHGHSSHHPKGIEVYRDKLILYGCGDFLNDYEGISGYEWFRPDLCLMYFPTIRLDGGRLTRLALIPLQIRHLRVNRAQDEDVRWMETMLKREGKALGTRVRRQESNELLLEWT